MKTSRKILLSIGAVGAAAGIAGMGTFATFTDSTSASQSIDSGLVDINLGAAGTNNRLTVAATDMLPGDTAQRRVKLTNNSTDNVPWVRLNTTATTSSALDTDATHGLQMVIERCTNGIGWSESGSSPNFTYTCDLATAGDNLGTKATVLASRAIIGTDIALSNLTATTAGATDDLRVTITLPSTAGNSLQNAASTIEYSFHTTQRTTAANK
ncbi:MAG TPA: TasA family protein [Acidimicrobiales bacterium]|nr:TasA family protein [Acidimicrobiales bacterium]